MNSTGRHAETDRYVVDQHVFFIESPSGIKLYLPKPFTHSWHITFYQTVIMNETKRKYLIITTLSLVSITKMRVRFGNTLPLTESVIHPRHELLVSTGPDDKNATVGNFGAPMRHV